MTTQRARLLAALVALVLLVAGCQVDATVSVVVADDGSGVVRVDLVLDQSAVTVTEAGGATLESGVRVDDLAAAGWKVRPWDRRPDGSAHLAVSKRFGRPEELAGIVSELNGSTGPVRALSVERTRSLLSTLYSARGVLDLLATRAGLDADPDLAALLAGQQVDLAAIEQALAARLGTEVSLSLRVKLPGGVGATVAATPGEATVLDASSSVRDRQRILLGSAGILLLVGVVVFVATGWRRRLY